jgi:membrane protein YqaA with SNARE-associated domain
VLLITLVLGATTKWWRFALWCSAASVLGGIAGYAIGMTVWDTVGLWIVKNIAHVDLVMNTASGKLDIPLPEYLHVIGGNFLFEVYDKWNAWIVFVFGLTPLPYKLVTITAGVAKINFPVFIFASLISRSMRFFLVAAILWKYGPSAKEFIDRHFNKLAFLFVILLIGGFALITVFFKK